MKQKKSKKYKKIAYHLCRSRNIRLFEKKWRVIPADAAMESILYIKPLLVIDGGRLDMFAKLSETKNWKKREIEQMKKQRNIIKVVQ